MVTRETLKAAERLARTAHAGQVDKAGRPYIEHVERVAAAVNDDPLAEAIAWLHDVGEDHPATMAAHLHLFPTPVVDGMFRLTRMGFGNDDGYLAEIRRDPVARRVKLADIADNADEARLRLLDQATADRLRRKYRAALIALGAAHPSDER